MTSGIGRRREAAMAEGGAAYAERRAEIIATAAAVFREKGYRGASLGDVAEKLGTDRASLYYYIESKEEVFHEIVRGAAEANAVRAEEIRDADSPVPEKIRLLITSLMSSYETHYPYLFVYIQEDLSQVGDGRSRWSLAMKEINKRYDDAVVDIVQSGLDSGAIRPLGSARIIANGLIGMVNWTHRWYHPDSVDLSSSTEIGKTFAELFMTGLQPKTVRRRSRVASK